MQVVKVEKQSFNDIEWVAISTKSYASALKSDELKISYLRRDKSKESPNSVLISIGYDLVSQLGWKYGDKITIHQNKDFEFQFLMAKSNGDNGRKLQQTNNSKHFVIEFKWQGKVALTAIKNQPIDYKIVKGNQLTFIASNE